MKRILLVLFTLTTLFSKAQSFAHYNGWGFNGNILGNNTSWRGSIDNRSFYDKTNSTIWRKLDSIGFTRMYSTGSNTTGSTDGQFWFNNAGTSGAGNGFSFYRPYN